MPSIFRGSGGRGRGFALFPPGIKFLLISNIAVFAFQMFFGNFHIGRSGSVNDFITRYLALWPLSPDAEFGTLFRPWQLVSYMFLHGGFMHILFNMFALWMFGIEVENTWGTRKFLTYYVICGLGAAAAHLILSETLGMMSGPLVGASGGIFGVLVAYGVMFPDNRIVFFPIFFPIKARFAVGIFIIIEVLSVGGNDNVGHLAHLGGAITGILYMVIASGGHLLRQKGSGQGLGGAWRSATNGGSTKPSASFWKKPSTRTGRSVDADYTDVDDATESSVSKSNVKQARVITQEEIDRILDKIAAHGYQTLSDDERDILFEASKRMEQRR